jgi:hypothetical protein
MAKKLWKNSISGECLFEVLRIRGYPPSPEVAMKIHGAYAFHDEFDVGDLYIAGALVTVGEGSSFIQRWNFDDDAFGWPDADRYTKYDKIYLTKFEQFAN